ncbi:MAG: DegT/DnrJ/EryC1/StrS family aminotransferase, partial [Candidatus Omnitrophica bacterium]|nr:DegT/DnrJ/EryC1/StrS family aminotransferase [Candidatus Omnitrophota bacterium]
TTAIHLALLAAGVQPGEIVITVSHSFITTANTIRYCLAEPVFVDIDPKSYNISVENLQCVLQNDCEKRSGELFYKHVDRLCHDPSPLSFLDKNKVKWGRVAAIMVVHQMGMPCALSEIVDLARQYKIPVIEDAACAIGSTYSPSGETVEMIGRPHGDLACFSFHPLKVLTTGEGGMITTNNEQYDATLRLLRHQGMSVSDIQRHQSKEVIIEEYPVVGFNYRMTDIQAAVGLVQLKNLPGVLEKRRAIARYYQEHLKDIAWLRLPEEPENASSNWQSFCIEILDNAPFGRNQIMQKLRDKGILTRLGIMNAHKEPPYRPQQWSLPYSEQMRAQAMILPVYVSMTEQDMARVVEALKAV